jgi:hypothetical protein
MRHLPSIKFFTSFKRSVKLHVLYTPKVHVHMYYVNYIYMCTTCTPGTHAQQKKTGKT